MWTRSIVLVCGPFDLKMYGAWEVMSGIGGIMKWGERQHAVGCVEGLVGVMCGRVCGQDLEYP